MSWIDQAATLPIAFAQVREDALLDLVAISKYCPKGANVLMVASGGCTACAIAARGLASSIHLSDINRAQLQLTQLKLSLLQAPLYNRLAILGHVSISAEARKKQLTQLCQKENIPLDAFGPIDLIAQIGLDYAGRYECVFAQLQQQLHPHAKTLQQLFESRSIPVQKQLIVPESPFGRDFDAALDHVLAQKNLVRLFGQGATANRVQEFSRHFAQRIRHFLSTLVAADSPYLSQMLLGRFFQNLLYPWFMIVPSQQMPKLTWSHAPMEDTLRTVEAGSMDFIHLSNIIDWLQPSEARQLLELTWNALRPGGVVFIRQLNSNIAIQEHEPRFNWLTEHANRLLEYDRSFLYRHLHLGRKPF